MARVWVSSLANVSASSLKLDSLTLSSEPLEAVDALKDLATTRVEPILTSLPAELRTAHPRITLKALNLGSDPATRNDKNRVARAVRNSGHTLVSSLSGFSECSIDHRQRSAQSRNFSIARLIKNSPTADRHTENVGDSDQFGGRDPHPALKPLGHRRRLHLDAFSELVVAQTTTGR